MAAITQKKGAFPIKKTTVPGFTLLETLLVLMITSLIITLFSFSSGKMVKIAQEELFVARFESSYKTVQFQSASTQQALSFWASNNQLHAGETILSIPDDVVVTDFSVKFDRNGNNSSLQKLKLYLPVEGKTVLYQLQMGSGKYKKTIN